MTTTSSGMGDGQIHRRLPVAVDHHDASEKSIQPDPDARKPGPHPGPQPGGGASDRGHLGRPRPGGAAVDRSPLEPSSGRATTAPATPARWSSASARWAASLTVDDHRGQGCAGGRLERRFEAFLDLDQLEQGAHETGHLLQPLGAGSGPGLIEGLGEGLGPATPTGAGRRRPAGGRSRPRRASSAATASSSRAAPLRSGQRRRHLLGLGDDPLEALSLGGEPGHLSLDRGRAGAQPAGLVLGLIDRAPAGPPARREPRPRNHRRQARRGPTPRPAVRASRCKTGFRGRQLVDER